MLSQSNAPRFVGRVPWARANARSGQSPAEPTESEERRHTTQSTRERARGGAGSSSAGGRCWAELGAGGSGLARVRRGSGLA